MSLSQFYEDKVEQLVDFYSEETAADTFSERNYTTNLLERRGLEIQLLEVDYNEALEANEDDYNKALEANEEKYEEQKVGKNRNQKKALDEKKKKKEKARQKKKKKKKKK